MANRTASVTWQGDLMSGAGRIESVGSGAISNLDVTWPSRSEDKEGGKTSPEELIGAAHAACFCMALAHGLAQAGTPPEQLDANAITTFIPGEGFTQVRLSVTGRVPGLDEAGFAAAAENAKENCPVSKALAGVLISLDAKLAE